MKLMESDETRHLIGAIQLGLPVVASSTWAPDHGVDRIRLDHNGARGGAQSFVAGFNDMNQFIQVASVTPLKWCAVETQGRPDSDQWLTSYLVLHSQDGNTWFAVDNGRIFTANQDRNSRVKNTFGAAVTARVLRVLPTSWQGHISFRCECYFKDELSMKSNSNSFFSEGGGEPDEKHLRMSDVVGAWEGNWGGGLLKATFADNGTGNVDLAGISSGTCTFRLNGKQLIVTVERQDGLKQGFVVVVAGEKRLEGTYVHFNCQSFSNMWLVSCST